MGLVALKEDLDSLVAQMPPAPSRPINPILQGVRRPDKAQQVLDSFESYENSLMSWRSQGLVILATLRRTIRQAVKNGRSDIVVYALEDTLPQCVAPIDDVMLHILQPWDALDLIERRKDLSVDDRRFVKHLQKRTREFSRSMTMKLGYLKDSFLGLPKEFEADLVNSKDAPGGRVLNGQVSVAIMELTKAEIDAISSSEATGRNYNLSDIPD